jgi:hypothetical protein
MLIFFLAAMHIFFLTATDNDGNWEGKYIFRIRCLIVLVQGQLF